MLEMNSRSIRFLARMGSRGTLGQAVYDYLYDGNSCYVVSADLSHASGFDRIQNEFPDYLINVGIAEQNLIGVAAGLAAEGMPVIATTWGMFASTRVADQVRNYMGFMQANVKLIGMDSGFVQSGFSYSHTNPPDIAIMRAIPGVKILSPCDGIECYKLIMEAMNIKGPVYIRLTGDSLQPIIHKTPLPDISIGKSITLREGTDVAIVACGNILNEVLICAEELEKKGISVKVIDMHTIVPLDYNVLDSIAYFPLLVTVEEHLKNGGLGSAVNDYYSNKYRKPVHLSLGVDDYYPKSGSMDYYNREVGIDSESIKGVIEKFFLESKKYNM